MGSLSTSQSLDQGDTWDMPGHFVLRSTGFAFDLLEQLRLTRTDALVTATIQGEEGMQQLQENFARQIFPRLCGEETAAGRDRETFRMWYALARRVRLGQLVDPSLIENIQKEYQQPDLAAWLHTWNAAVDNVAHAKHAGAVCFADEFEVCRTILRDIVVTSRFQEALWLSNPGVYETGWQYYQRHWDINMRPSKMKHLERRFYTYLQRFCAKNDTTSFFGPLNYGTCGEREQAAYHQTPEMIRARRVFLAYWAVEALAQCIANDSAAHPYLIPRRHPARGWKATDQEKVENAIYACSDGEQRIIDIATHLKLPLEDIVRTAGALAEQGWLLLAPVLPPATLLPLDLLTATVQAWPDIPPRQCWLSILKQFAELCARFTTANFEERRSILASAEEFFTTVVGSPTRRGQGKMFQDRSLLYEECLGNIDAFHLSRKHSQTLKQALAPIASLCASFSEAWWYDLRARADALFESLRPGGQPLRFTTFIRHWRARFPTLPPTPKADALQRLLCELVKPYHNEHMCQLDLSELARLCTESEHHYICSPDILLAAASEQELFAGHFTVILGEIHHGVQPAGWILLFAEDQQAWQKAITGCLPRPTEHSTPANLILGRHMKTAPPEFPGPGVQASAPSERLHQLNLSDLFVKREGGQLYLGRAHEPGGLLFYPPSYGVPDVLYAPFAVFSYPLMRAIQVRLEEHTPRIEIGGAVYQRERWDLATTMLPECSKQRASFDLLLAFARFRRRFDMPERVFVRTPAEPKPVYIDFQDVFALEMLTHLASQSDTITFVEMYPGPRDLWLRDDHGRYCSEFRLLLSQKPLRSPGNSASANAALPKGERV